MERYTTKKDKGLTKKQGIISKSKSFKKEISQLEKEIRRLERNKVTKTDKEIMKIDEEIERKRHQLESIKRSYKDYRKAKSEQYLAIVLVLVTAALAYGTHKSNENFEENLVDAYEIIEDSEQQEVSIVVEKDNLSFENMKSDLEEYSRLSQKENLTKEEKEKLKNIKERINANPEGITQLSLDVLKQKIANSLGIEDYSRIKIMNKSTEIKADQFNPESGVKTLIYITVDGNTVASIEKFQSISSGEVKTYSDTIPDEIIKVLNKVVNAQEDPQDKNKAVKALKSAVTLDEKDITGIGMNQAQKQDEGR